MAGMDRRWWGGVVGGSESGMEQPFLDLSSVTYFPLRAFGEINLVPAVAGKPELAVGPVPASHACLSLRGLMARGRFLLSQAPHHVGVGGHSV